MLLVTRLMFVLWAVLFLLVLSLSSYCHVGTCTYGTYLCTF